MNYTIQDLQDEIIPMMHSVSSMDKIKNPFGAMRRAYINMLKDISPVGAIRTIDLPVLINAGQSLYAIPSDVARIINLYGTNGPISYTETANNGVKLIKIDYFTGSVLDNMTDASLWSFSDINNVISATVSTDTSWSYSDGTSIKTEWTNINTLEKSFKITKTYSDKTLKQGKNVINIPMRFSDVTIFNANPTISLYLNGSLTPVIVTLSKFDGTQLENGMNIMVGAIDIPVSSTLDKIDIGIKVKSPDVSTLASFNIDSIVIDTGMTARLSYVTYNIFKSISDIRSFKPSDISDIIMLDDDSFNILLYHCIKAMSQQSMSSDSKFDIDFSNSELYGGLGKNGLVPQYNLAFPSAVKKSTSKYYRI